jgi:twitching motility two-component system response regulator PilG
MKSLLVIDDDDAMRRLIRLSLMDSHQIFDTGDPEQVLALALEHEPDGILLDLRMPRYSGFELCQTFTSLSSTQLIPVIVVSGEAGARTKELCRDLGAAAYFEKPVNFDALRNQLADLLRNRRSERRSEARVRLRVPLKLVGRAQSNEPFRTLTATENASSGSFLCACGIALSEGSLSRYTWRQAQMNMSGRHKSFVPSGTRRNIVATPSGSRGNPGAGPCSKSVPAFA